METLKLAKIQLEKDKKLILLQILPQIMTEVSKEQKN